MQIERSILIKALPEAVWEVVTDPMLAPRWSRHIRQVCEVTNTPFGVGTTWTQTGSLSGREVTHRARVTVFEPTTRMEVQMVGPGSPKLTTSLQRQVEGTHLTQVIEVELPGGLMKGAIARMVLPAMGRELEATLRRLKETLEQEAARR